MDTIRFIVRTRHEGATLTDFLAQAGTDPALQVVDTIGPTGRPHTAVVATSADYAACFEQRFSHHEHLIVERDRPLSLFDKTASFLHRTERKTNA